MKVQQLTSYKNFSKSLKMITLVFATEVERERPDITLQSNM